MFVTVSSVQVNHEHRVNAAVSTVLHYVRACSCRWLLLAHANVGMIQQAAPHSVLLSLSAVFVVNCRRAGRDNWTFVRQISSKINLNYI